jgi:hypothetical protein
LQAESISWYVSGMPSSTLMEVVFNGLLLLSQTSPKMHFICTIPIHLHISCIYDILSIPLW